ncbi:hypothetical protein CBF34_03400 [Vagococcus penaei]|uniref:Uncharacterized protein n=1 Tax=Vagococcus penaei TaxID=633807 RepID=A0A1Q2D7E4_9ENTE|nr:two-component system regulatory protein YycI [Vagococcus penaei]AQP54298.1 hypothetical protein BW732_08735 [Vagococcus penaei]RSU05816.1 hypothetical protein CBF34_03400 [Vagococcus penaei]
MDFKRVEGIFLVVFFLMNIFLFYTYQETRIPNQPLTAGTISEHIEERLKQDEITAPTNLSEEIKEGYYLAASDVNLAEQARKQLKNQEWAITNSVLHSTFMSNSEVNILEKVDVNSLEHFILNPENVINGKAYVFDQSRSKDKNKFVFTQEWEGIPFLDDTSILSVTVDQSQAGITFVESYDQNMLSSDIEPLREKQSLISERDAVISLYTNNRLPVNSKISRIQLGYSKIFTVREKGIYIPTWFIEVNNNKNNSQIERVNAFTSAIITSNVSEVKN